MRDGVQRGPGGREAGKQTRTEGDQGGQAWNEGKRRGRGWNTTQEGVWDRGVIWSRKRWADRGQNYKGEVGEGSML